MWFTILILIIVFYVFVRPAWKIWSAVNSARRQAREMGDAFRRAAGVDPAEERRRGEERRRASRKGGWTSPAPRRKKIDPGVGEYVKFKEVSADDTASTSSDAGGGAAATAAQSEPQVVDVKWEDVD